LPLLTADAAAEISAPMLTCISVSDGYQYELLLRVARDEPEINRVRIGPYFFKQEYVPRSLMGGLLCAGGPESCLLMHKSSPSRWSRLRWEVDESINGSPAFLTWNGSLQPGSVGAFRFVSLMAPGGLRVGLQIDSEQGNVNYGVTGPNYERFEAKNTEH